MDKRICQCHEGEWESWLKLYDHGHPIKTPTLWFATGCYLCGKATWIPYSPDLPKGTVPEDILQRGLDALTKHIKEVA